MILEIIPIYFPELWKDKVGHQFREVLVYVYSFYIAYFKRMRGCLSVKMQEVYTVFYIVEEFQNVFVELTYKSLIDEQQFACHRFYSQLFFHFSFEAVL